MRNFLIVTFTIFANVFFMGAIMCFILNSYDIMNWHWTARLWLICWGLIIVYKLQKVNKIDS